MASEPYAVCPRCQGRHGRAVLEIRVFEHNLDGSTETVDTFRADQIEGAIAALVQNRQNYLDPDIGPVAFSIDIWVVDADLGDGLPLDSL